MPYKNKEERKKYPSDEVDASGIGKVDYHNDDIDPGNFDIFHGLQPHNINK